MSWSFKIALATDCIAIIVALYFIISDSIRYPRATHNATLSLVTLLFCGWVGTSYYLYHHGQKGIASSMAWVPAIPLLGYGFIVLAFIILKPDMR